MMGVSEWIVMTIPNLQAARLRQTLARLLNGQYDLELYSAMTSLFLGILLLLPADTFSSSASYAAMRIFPEWLWGTTMLVLAIFQMAGLLLENRGVRQMTTLLGAGIYTFWFLGIAFANPISTGVVTYAMLMASCLIAHYRLGR